jgi:molybdenum cofactor cytidylyltransferase
MGTPKALLTLQGETFLSRIIGAMRGGGCERVLVVTVPAVHRAVDPIAVAAKAAGAEPVENPDPDSEQIDSFRCAIRALTEWPDALVAAPVDSPGATAEMVATLVAAVRSGAPIAVPTFGGRRGHPVVFSGRVLAELLEPDLPSGARTVIHRYDGELIEVPAPDAAVLLDVDTPQDYARLTASEG